MEIIELGTEFVVMGVAAVVGLVAVIARRRASAKRASEASAMTDAALSARIFWLNADDNRKTEFHAEAERRAAAKKVLDRAA